MKALDKVLDETMPVKYFIGDKFHFTEAKKISYMKIKKRTDKKDGIKVTIVTEEKSNRIYQSQSEWNIERCIKLQVI